MDPDEGVRLIQIIWVYPAEAEKGDAEMVIKRIGPVSCAKITGTLYAILGLVIGGVFSLVALAGVRLKHVWSCGRSGDR